MARAMARQPQLFLQRRQADAMDSLLLDLIARKRRCARTGRLQDSVLRVASAASVTGRASRPEEAVAEELSNPLGFGGQYAV